jgi:hypothetical protein
VTLVAVAPHVKIPGLQPAGYKSKTYDWRETPGSPGNTRGIRAECVAMDLVAALNAEHRTDAHCFTYAVPGMDRTPRLTKGMLSWFIEQTGKTPVTTCFMADVDNPGHAPWDATAHETFEETWANAPALLTAGVYFSKHGWRVVQPLTVPIPVTESEAYLARWLRILEAQGIPVDWACRDWTRYFRLPCVLRDGRPYRSPIVRLERMVRVAIEPLPPELLEQARTKTKRSARATVAVGPVAWDTAVPKHWRARVETLAAAVRGAEGSWHALFLALAGALCECDVTPALVPAICVAVSHATGADSRPDDRETGARTTVEKHLAHLRHTGMRELAAAWPDVARAVQTVTATAGIAKLLRQAGAEVDVDPMPIALATGALERAMRTAADGVTLIQAACGLGKTNRAQAVAVERARLQHPNPESASTRAPTGSKTAISVDKHELAMQVCRAVETMGGTAKRLFGPLSLKHGDGSYVCKFHDAAEHLVGAGDSPSSGNSVRAAVDSRANTSRRAPPRRAARAPTTPASPSDRTACSRTWPRTPARRGCS